MLIYNLINNSTKKSGKKSLQTFAHIKKSRTFASFLRNRAIEKIKDSGCSAVRLAHLLWEQGVVGSNPATPTKEKDFDNQ